MCNCCSSLKQAGAVPGVEHCWCYSTAAKLPAGTGHGLLHRSLPLNKPTSSFPSPVGCQPQSTVTSMGCDWWLGHTQRKDAAGRAVCCPFQDKRKHHQSLLETVTERESKEDTATQLCLLVVMCFLIPAPNLALSMWCYQRKWIFRIHQHRQAHFCRGRWPVLHKVSRAFTGFQTSLHASSWLPIKILKGLWSQDACPYEKGRGKITGVRQTLDSSYCNSSDPSQPLWSVPEIADLVWSVMSWKAEQSCSGQIRCLTLLALVMGGEVQEKLGW